MPTHTCTAPSTLPPHGMCTRQWSFACVLTDVRGGPHAPRRPTPLTAAPQGSNPLDERESVWGG
eukprot:2738684-Prymnesium_polylepis.1